MSRRNRSRRTRRQGRVDVERQQNRTMFKTLTDWLIPRGRLFAKHEFHGNIKWIPEQLALQAILWAWQAAKNVTDAFAEATEVCEDLKLTHSAKTYTSFMDALVRYGDVLSDCLRQQFQSLAEEAAGRSWRDRGWVLIAFDGSRVTTPRTVSNERAFCAANYGRGKTAKYRKKKTKGMRRRNNEKNKAQPQSPQVWITMLWHMGLRLPWTWRLGPSNSSERGHVLEILKEEEFPENTLFCGDAGFVGYDFWKSILVSGSDFLVRIGANVNLLTQQATVERLGRGRVLCWPKDKIHSGAAPLSLRLVRAKVGPTTMWMLTSVLSPQKLPHGKIVKYYKMRWGVEVEYRGLKQTVDKRTLRCHNSDRVYVELDWSIRAMAFAELVALREQISSRDQKPARSGHECDPKDASLANALRALRKCMRNLHKRPPPSDNLFSQLANAVVQKYNNRSGKKARYRPQNKDKKPLGNPTIRKLNRQERKKLAAIDHKIAA